MLKRLTDICSRAMETSGGSYVNRYTKGFMAVLAHLDLSIPPEEIEKLAQGVQSTLKESNPAIQELTDSNQVLTPEGVLGLFYWEMVQTFAQTWKNEIPEYKNMAILDVDKDLPLEILVHRLRHQMRLTRWLLSKVGRLQWLAEPVCFLFDSLAQCVDPKVFAHRYKANAELVPWRLDIKEMCSKHQWYLKRYGEDILKIRALMDKSRAKIEAEKRRLRKEQVSWCKDFIKKHNLDLPEGDIVEQTRRYLYACAVWRSTFGQPSEDLRGGNLSLKILWMEKGSVPGMETGFFYGYMYHSSHPSSIVAEPTAEELYAPIEKVRHILRTL